MSFGTHVVENIMSLWRESGRVLHSRSFSIFLSMGNRSLIMHHGHPLPLAGWDCPMPCAISVCCRSHGQLLSCGLSVFPWIFNAWDAGRTLNSRMTLTARAGWYLHGVKCEGFVYFIHLLLHTNTLKVWTRSSARDTRALLWARQVHHGTLYLNSSCCVYIAFQSDRLSSSPKSYRLFSSWTSKECYAIRKQYS